MKGLRVFLFYPFSVFPCSLNSEMGGDPGFLKRGRKTGIESTRKQKPPFASEIRLWRDSYFRINE